MYGNFFFNFLEILGFKEIWETFCSDVITISFLLFQPVLAFKVGYTAAPVHYSSSSLDTNL